MEPEHEPSLLRQLSKMQREQAASDALERLQLANGVSLDEVQPFAAPATRLQLFCFVPRLLHHLLCVQMTCVSLNKDGMTRCHRKKALDYDCCWQHKKEQVEEQSSANPANQELKAELEELKKKVAEFEEKEALEKQIKEGEAMAKAYVYKTSLCKYFKEKGSCKLGAECTFAHGNAELRKVGGTQAI